ncbi:uncharacterized protein EV422DRAFT_67414 [Fimicolochytrium jonesii]|uniref:uncharacterized protein n=1 Tax=Fimicolochytrium jonesii TaxID=1396493 RepID=UPI0022FE699C|nr:uncharacterized protein EV422DRAFT_67414 [Fimicolochytrium jonesii]KAI8820357.1 hypothetical protein EV422DRAFT_67414 [Fimicolochytrium jonesii]
MPASPSHPPRHPPCLGGAPDPSASGSIPKTPGSSSSATFFLDPNSGLIVAADRNTRGLLGVDEASIIGQGFGSFVQDAGGRPWNYEEIMRMLTRGEGSSTPPASHTEAGAQETCRSNNHHSGLSQLLTSNSATLSAECAGKAKVPVSVSWSVMDIPGKDAIRVLLAKVENLRGLADKSEKILEAVFATSLKCIIVISAEGSIQLFSSAAEKLFQYSEHEIRGKNINILMPSPLRELHDGYLKNKDHAHRRSVIGTTREVLAQRRDGVCFPIELSVSEMRIGDRLFYTGILHDLSETRRAAAEREKNAALLTSVINSTVDAVCVIDSQGILELFNPAAEKIWGYPADEVLGKHVGLLVPNLSHVHDGQFSAYMEADQAQVPGTSREASAQRKDGTIFPCDLAISDFHVAGERKFTAVIRDISDRQTAQRRIIEQANQLAVMVKISERARLRFLGTMSHELRTPLTAIIANADLILDNKLTDDQSHCMVAIQAAGISLLKSVNSILMHIELDTTNQPSIPVATSAFVHFDLNALLDETVQCYAVEAAKAGLDLMLLISAPVPAAVIGDPWKLRQILDNLLSNAVKFASGPGGWIVVALDVVKKELDSVDLSLQVQDNGCGIPEDQTKLIWEAFMQVDATDTRRFDGVGIGLPMSKQLAALISGTLTVESSISPDDHGSTFSLEFTVSLAFPPVVPVWLPGLRGLVIHPRRMVCDVLLSHLASRGLKVLGLANPEAAVDVIAASATSKTKFDFVIADEAVVMSSPALAAVLKEFPAGVGILAAPTISFERSSPLQDVEGFRGARWLKLPLGPAMLKQFLARSIPGLSMSADDLSPAGKSPGVIEKPLDGPGPLKTEVIRPHADPPTEGRIGATHAITHVRERPHALVAEDNTINQRIMRQHLKKLNVTCDIASDGVEAVSQYTSNPSAFDIILLDLNMPKMSGIEAAALIRQWEIANLLRRIPITVVSANAYLQDDCVGLMDDFVPKPFARADLRRTLLRYCEGYEELGESPAATLAGKKESEERA